MTRMKFHENPASSVVEFARLKKENAQRGVTNAVKVEVSWSNPQEATRNCTKTPARHDYEVPRVRPGSSLRKGNRNAYRRFPILRVPFKRRAPNRSWLWARQYGQLPTNLRPEPKSFREIVIHMLFWLDVVPGVAVVSALKPVSWGRFVEF